MRYDLDDACDLNSDLSPKQYSVLVISLFSYRINLTVSQTMSTSPFKDEKSAYLTGIVNNTFNVWMMMGSYSH